MTKLVLATLFIVIIGCTTLPDYIGTSEAWTTPGLVLADGSRYKTPKPNKTTGQRINVLNFGAIPNDKTFDNTVSFNAAIESAEPGDEVFVPSGSYYFFEAAFFAKDYVAHISLKSRVNFIGEGSDSTFLISNFDDDTNKKYKTAVVLSRTQSHIVMSGFTVSSLTDDSLLPDPNISNSNNFVGSAPVYGIVIDNAKPTEVNGNIVIDSVIVEKFQRMGIRIRLVRDVRVLNSVVQKATDLGGGGAGYGISIQGRSNGADLTDSTLDTLYNVVENCDIKGPYLRHGILLQYYTHNNLITNNRVSNTLLDAIDLHGEDEYSNEISFNTVTNTRNGAAIGVGNSGATHDATGPYNYIHNNTIIGGDRGIDILYGTPNTIITSNIIRDIETNDATGIFMQNAPNTKIIDNKFSNFTGLNSIGIKSLYSYYALKPESGIPEGIIIRGNSFEKLFNGVYSETYTENYIFKNNSFDQMAYSEYIDDKTNFTLPPISDIVIPKVGDLLLPTDDNFITNENRKYPQTQPNMKLKSSIFDVPYNRMIYIKFDLADINLSNKNIYLRLTAKSKDGLATVNIHGTTKYTNWKEKSITWDKAPYHKDQVAQTVKDSSLDHVTDFTFTTVGTEFNTYYINVTNYIQNLESDLVTLILSNDLIENMYCEIYSKEIKTDDYKLGLLISNK